MQGGEQIFTLLNSTAGNFPPAIMAQDEQIMALVVLQ